MSQIVRVETEIGDIATQLQISADLVIEDINRVDVVLFDLEIPANRIVKNID